MARANAILFVLAVAAAGCSRNPTNPPGGNGPVSFVGRACSVDAECGDLRCDTIRRQCICLSDESCQSQDPNAPIRYCNNYTGLCVEEISGCKSDLDCQDTEYCDSAIRACRAKKSFCAPCEKDNECGGEGDLCIEEPSLGAKFCGRACATNEDCARGSACVDKGGTLQCWPAPNPLTPAETATCATFKSCTPDSLAACDGDDDCAGLGDQRCDPARGQCVAIEQACPFGTACDSRHKICVAQCIQDSDCGDDKLRCINRVCEPISVCATDSECPITQVCSVPAGQSTGECIPVCQSNDQCPVGQVCRQGNDMRARCEPGCTQNTHCALDQRCNAQGQCEGPTVGSTRTCQATPVCQICEFCSATESACKPARDTYPYCVECMGSNECADGLCVLYDAQVGGDGKSYCSQFCGAGQECPQGFSCRSLGGGTQYVCIPTDFQCAGKCQ